MPSLCPVQVWSDIFGPSLVAISGQQFLTYTYILTQRAIFEVWAWSASSGHRKSGLDQATQNLRA